MSSDIKNFSNSDMDISQSLISVEDKHYNLTNETNNYDVKSKLDMQNMTEKLIANESQINIEPILESGNHSPSIESLVDTKEKEAEDGKRINKQFLNNIIVYTTEEYQNLVGLSAQNKSNNKSTDVGTSNQNEYDASIDERLPETVTLLTTPDGGKLYLVGTAHFSVDSQNDVSTIIQAVQPHTVVVELCKARVGILQLNEEVLYHNAKNLSYQTIKKSLKEYGIYNGLLHVLLLQMVARVSKQLGMAPGGEFRRAFEEAKKVPNCIIQLADRPINITIERAVRSLPWWQTIKLGWNLMRLKGHISKKDIENYKQKSLLDNMIDNLKKEYPVMERVFVTERDLCLTYSLQVACMPRWTSKGVIPARVVGIVGIGHTPGITKNWGKVKPSDIMPVMSVPPKSLSSKILKFTVKVSLFSVIIYTGYKILPLPSGIALQSIRSSIKGFLKVSGGK